MRANICCDKPYLVEAGWLELVALVEADPGPLEAPLGDGHPLTVLHLEAVAPGPEGRAAAQLRAGQVRRLPGHRGFLGAQSVQDNT